MPSRPRLIGVNHIALEVDDLEAALAFHGELFDFEIRGRAPGMAFLDMGDQFLALSEGRIQPPDDGRHFGLVVDDLDAVRQSLARAGVNPLPGRGLDFLDSSGNGVQLIEYAEVRFSKADPVARGMGIDGLTKSESARDELRKKGLLG